MSKRLAMVTLCCAALLAPLRAGATDYTDIWYLPAESGWGVNLIENDNVIFATFFVYGSTNQPTWFVAILDEDQNGNFSGNLYTTVGPYYGGPWNPAIYMPTLAGTASFVPSSPYAGSLTYTFVSGPTVVKSIQRQTLTTVSLDANYVGTQAGAYSKCNDSSQNGPYSDPFALTVTVANGVATFAFNYESGSSCTMAGNLTQVGKLYQISPASYSCTGNLAFNASATIDEITATAYGIEARFTANLSGGCVESAVFEGPLSTTD